MPPPVPRRVLVPTEKPPVQPHGFAARSLPTKAVRTMKKPNPDPQPEQRIAKLLARAGIASRREIERMIAEGRVAVNGTPVETPATLLASLHGVTVDGQPVKAAAPARLFRFHKPSGLLTTERDPKGRPTIYDRLPQDLPRVMPVGRLDLNTEGLLLMTTDGELKRQLELPSTGVTRSYRARAFGDVSQAQLEALIEGVEIEGIRYGSIDANLERRTGRNQWIELSLTEGKNREVRRVLEHLGLQVSRLIRTAYGPFQLADLSVGAVDEVRQHDLVVFRTSLRGVRVTEIAPPPDPKPRASSVRPTPRRPSTMPKLVNATGSRPAGPARTRRESRPPEKAPRPARQSVDRVRPQAVAKPQEQPTEPRPARPKRGAGWAKPKPRTAPHRGSGKRPLGRDRPKGGKR